MFCHHEGMHQHSNAVFRGNTTLLAVTLADGNLLTAVKRLWATKGGTLEGTGWGHTCLQGSKSRAFGLLVQQGALL